MSLFIFLVEKGAINSTYATVAWMKGHPKCEQLRIEGGNVTPYVSLWTYAIPFYVFCSICALCCFVLHVKI